MAPHHPLATACPTTKSRLNSALTFGTPLAALLLSVLCVSANADGSAATSTNSPTPGLPGQNLTGANRPRSQTPAPPGTRSPAETFRELLAMSPAERELTLADRTEHQRAYIEQRLREYSVLPTGQREARLRQMDLTWHVESLMKLPPSRRGSRLATVPPELRPLVDEKLRVFDRLAPDVQKQVLSYRSTANYFLAAKPAEPPLPGQLASPPLPDTQDNGRMAEHLGQFLELPPKEQQKILDALPADKRGEMERTLNTFANLSPAQRRICFDSFERFSRLTKEQREQFLKNAARWKAMSPRERETWRELVEIVPPIGTPAVHAPMPPRSEPAAGPATASNSTAAPTAAGTPDKGH